MHFFYLYSWKKKKTKQNEYSRGWKEVGSVSLDRYITVATFESFNSRGASFFSMGPGRLIQVSVFLFLFFFFIMTVDRKHVSLQCMYVHTQTLRVI